MGDTRLDMHFLEIKRGWRIVVGTFLPIVMVENISECIDSSKWKDYLPSKILIGQQNSLCGKI